MPVNAVRAPTGWIARCQPTPLTLVTMSITPLPRLVRPVTMEFTRLAAELGRDATQKMMRMMIPYVRTFFGMVGPSRVEARLYVLSRAANQW